MTLPPFAYLEPTSLEEVTSALAEPNQEAALLAGGTDLLVMLKAGVVQPSLVVNLKRVPGLDALDFDKGELRIGALTKIRSLELSPLIRERFASLNEAAAHLGSLQIRNLATIGGNLCRAAPCAEMAPPLIVLDARVGILGPDGSREVPIESFFIGPGEIVLERGEILTEVIAPAPGPRSGAAYLRHSVRAKMDLAIVNVAASLDLADDGKTISRARIALGSVAPTPIRALRAEASLVGSEGGEESFRKAALIAGEESKPITDVRSTAEYRRSMVELFVGRALDRAFMRCGGG